MNKSKWCCVPGCKCSRDEVFHPFPEDEVVQDTWLRVIQAGNKSKGVFGADARVCSLHFKDEDYISVPRSDGRVIECHLRPDAVPSLFPWLEKKPVDSSFTSPVNPETSTVLTTPTAPTSPATSRAQKTLRKDTADTDITSSPSSLEKQFRCDRCDFVARNLGAALRHRECHGAQGRFKCHYCDYASNYSKTLADHLLRGHSSQNDTPKVAAKRDSDVLTASDDEPTAKKKRKLFVLDDDDDESSSSQVEMPATLETQPNHLEISSQGQEERISDASDSDTQPTEEHGKVLINLPDSLVVTTVYLCEYCDFWAVNVRDFHLHQLKRHQSSKWPAFMCSVCSFASSSLEAIRQHIRNQLKSPNREMPHSKAKAAMTREVPSDYYLTRLRDVKTTMVNAVVKRTIR